MSLAGAVSVVAPVPDTILVFTVAGMRVGGSWVFDPMLIALAATLGSVVGQVSGYMLGLGSKKVMTGKYKKNVDFLAKALSRFGPIAIFAFALTPFPDDLVFIPLGSSKYSPLKAFVPSIAGKLLLSMGIAFAGRFSIGFISDVLGGGGELASVVISLGVGMTFAAALFKVDWSSRFEALLFNYGPERRPLWKATIDNEMAKSAFYSNMGAMNIIKLA